ncbi:ribosome biogenesis GTPase Der [Dehalogenimonas etheniformans]|uniref:GTPase Der n=1 Tax=Dehalogenimonas etheniformans TaxID=1536648 RepID=A0A2P5P5E0_9CHLR|nr:ribosome biogenesis GTPase Der [Dehalogenimonas etheniformans]PPD57518.1 ribosome biogenesis GTPase Der [Dehalogenimonas etheniformans]QNT76879.1 ribosome biogenesis GTPase Der [Dehalogenimonas etheniformans]
MNKLPSVAIVGRQNVGKSTLLNRLTGKRQAITEDLPGTTRDRLYIPMNHAGRDFELVDTGGMESLPQDTIARAVNDQVRSAMKAASVVVFLVDAQTGMAPLDHEIADEVRKSGKPVVVAVNKADNARLSLNSAEFHSLGFGEPMPVSAFHGRGVEDLLDRIVELLPEPEAITAAPSRLRIAIAGRANVGKSSLLNALVGEERVIVSPVPGTTRDSIDTPIDTASGSVVLIDTAGIRRRGKIERGVEEYSVIRSLNAIDRADIVLIVLDASEPATAQDTHIAGYAKDQGRGLVLVVNKIDLLENVDMTEYDRNMAARFKFIPYAQRLYVSARTGDGVDRVIPASFEIQSERCKRIPTPDLNSLVRQALARHAPPSIGGKLLKVLYATQVGVCPPEIVFFVNDPKLVHFSFERFLENRLREVFGFTGTPIKFTFKSRGE